VDVLIERCAGIDIGKDEVVACVRTPGPGGKGRAKQTRTFRSFTGELEAMADWFLAEGVTDIAMEATGSYWKPVWYVLEDRPFKELKLVNAQHLKILPGRKSDKASLKDWVSFSLAPRSGERAPQGACLRYPSRTTMSLFEEFRGTASTLLLFDGLAHTAKGYANLSRIAHSVNTLLGDEIKTHIVVSANDRPEQLDWDGSILLDPDHQLHRRYGAGAASLYFIRPDGYIGFRSQPAREEPLLAYLGELFLR